MKRYHSNMHQKIAFTCAAALVLPALLTACSGGAGSTGGDTKAGGATNADTGKPTEISIFANQQGAQAVDSSNELLKEIEKKQIQN